MGDAPDLIVVSTAILMSDSSENFSRSLFVPIIRDDRPAAKIIAAICAALDFIGLVL